ncbi:LETM1 domain-containing protein 1 [Chionoecetes opilio]|uniref:LETM1 domain-containing protein 1 n=1 Tax=Chionoecetes opilio TaxID=41210 RepID=A0A8J8WEE9_CHIOP|nr:LETM1 domain-containing protein 1 [Chionoecetes opilio]
MLLPLLKAGVLRCSFCTYRWPRRGCKSQQCLYYWSSLWPWGGHSSPLEAAAIHTATMRTNSHMASTSHHGALKRRDSFYIPHSFPAQYCINNLSACRGMRTMSYLPRNVLLRNETVTLGHTIVEDQFYSQKNSYSSGQPRKEGENLEGDKTVKTKEVAKEGDQSTVLPENVTTDIKKTEKGNAMGSEQLPSRVQRFFLWRYSRYLGKFQESLKNEMPDTFRMFSIFTVGLKDFIIDFKELIKILAFLSLPGSTLSSLNRQELEVYHRMPGDMVRVFPVLVLSSLPFGQNVAFPIGYWFPRHLLCHHFWDIQQRHEFARMGLQSRLFNARPVFRSLQAALLSLGEEDREKCRTVFHKLGSGIHPTLEEIVELVPLFRGAPFHINKIGAKHVQMRTRADVRIIGAYIYQMHKVKMGSYTMLHVASVLISVALALEPAVNALLRLHGRSVWVMRRQRLRDHARILHCMDAAVSREGIDSLTLDNLKTILFFRGLNPTHMSKATMLEYLNNWLEVSREVDASSYSLLSTSPSSLPTTSLLTLPYCTHDTQTQSHRPILLYLVVLGQYLVSCCAIETHVGFKFDVVDYHDCQIS